MRLIQKMCQLFALAICASLFSLSGLVAAQDSPETLCEAAQPAPLTPMQFEAPEAVLEAGVDYRAIFCTTAGAVYVDLYEKLTPQTVNNFIFLAQQGYYDSTTFHRVIPDFMAQGGDPTATGSGGPGYKFADEPVGFLVFDRPGLLAMANAGPGTNGSQFFITTVPTPHLNHRHTIFGDVLSGQANVEAIQERDPASATGPGETLHTVLIISDPTRVDNSALEPLPAASQDEVIAAFEAFAASMPPSLPVNESASGLFSAAQIAENMPPALQEAYADYAETYGHQYRYRLELVNGDCESAIYFSALGYQVDVFETAEAAAAALADEELDALLAGQGFEMEERDPASYSKALPTCAGEPGAHSLMLYTYGRFLVSLDVLVAEAVLEAMRAQTGLGDIAVLQNLALQIEPAFSAIYWPELR